MAEREVQQGGQQQDTNESNPPAERQGVEGGGQERGRGQGGQGQRERNDRTRGQGDRPQQRPGQGAQGARGRDEPQQRRDRDDRPPRQQERDGVLSAKDILAVFAQANVQIGPAARQADLGPQARQSPIKTGHVLGMTSGRMVYTDGDGNPHLVCTEDEVNRRLAEVRQTVEREPVVIRESTPATAITADDVRRAEEAAQNRTLEMLRLARELAPQPIIQQAPPIPAKKFTYFRRRDIENGGSTAREIVSAKSDEREDIHALEMGDAEIRRAEHKRLPAWVWPAIFVPATLLLGILGWRACDSAQVAEVYQSKVAAAEKRAEVAESRPANYYVSAGEVIAAEVYAGGVNAGDVTATGDITATGRITATGDLHHNVTRNVTAVRVIRDESPAPAPQPQATPAPTAPTATVPVAPGPRCTGWWAGRKDGSAKCFTDKESAANEACSKRGEYTTSGMKALGGTRRWVNLCAGR